MTTDQPQQPDVSGTVFEEKAAVLARTYAEALVNAAENQGAAETVLDEVTELVQDVWRDQPAFAEILSNPGVRTEEKDRMLVQAFEGPAQPVVLNFLRVLNRHERLGLLPAVAQRAREIWERRHNLQPATIRSAVPLDEGQIATLRDRLIELTGGATPVIHLEVDPDLIGGLIIQVGDVLYDASVRSQIQQFHNHLLTTRRREIQTRGSEFVQL